MVKGLIKRYSQAAMVPPKLLYVDSGCCKDTGGQTKLEERFSGWPDLTVRLDIYHFMRRLAVGCTTDAHPLYPTFMARLSSCIFEWDPNDVALLRLAKRKQLKKEGVPGVTSAMVDRNITKDELAQYCRRRTRGEETTILLIQTLLQELMGEKGRDQMGVPLLDNVRMEHIWRVQQRHVKCIQDVPGVPLYTDIGNTTVEGIVLTRYRCARGSTSLESFHLHLNRFIPGTQANSLNFQLYLLEGLNRWNHNRSVESVASKPPSFLCYSGDLLHSVNNSSLKVLGRRFVPSFQPPTQYTGELIGIDYLYEQTGHSFPEMEKETEETDELLEDIALEYEHLDEGFDEPVFPILDNILADPLAATITIPAVTSPSIGLLLVPPSEQTSVLSQYPPSPLLPATHISSPSPHQCSVPPVAPLTQSSASCVAPPALTQSSASCVAPPSLTQSSASCVAPPALTQSSASCVAPPALIQSSASCVAPPALTQSSASCVAPPALTQSSASCVAPPALTQSSASCVAPPALTQSSASCVAPPALIQSSASCVAPPALTQSSASCVAPPALTQSSASCVAPPALTQSSASCVAPPALIQSSASCVAPPALTQSSASCVAPPALTQSSASCVAPPALTQSSASCVAPPALTQSSASCVAPPALIQSSASCVAPAPVAQMSASFMPLAPLASVSATTDATTEEPVEQLAVDDHNIPGMDRVDSLAEYLVGLRSETSLIITNQKASTIIGLWQNLLPYDQQRVAFAARYQDRLTTGRFRSPKKKREFTPGVESLKRCILSSSGSPAQWPDCCRLLEAIFVKLCGIHRSPKKQGQVTLSRWALILKDYSKIRQLILGNGAVMQSTTLQLVEVNSTTLNQWYNKRVKKQDVQLVLQGINLPSSVPVATEPLQPANLRPAVAPPPPGVQHVYHLPQSTVGQAKCKKRAASTDDHFLPPSARQKMCAQRKLFPKPSTVPSSQTFSLQTTTTLSQPAVIFKPSPPLSSIFTIPVSFPVSSVSTVAQTTATTASSVAPTPSMCTTKKSTSKARFNKRRVEANSCRKCGQFRTETTGHSQYKGKIYCPNTETMSREKWLEETKKRKADHT
ncbi:histone deacetylase complex subunit SAP130-like [Astyanax mexicanus]|uniref:histone deacetylase complex subunit SAP130-like n=1 Tax=Astyanax mexicanus TaxID=7994 RepID=UPI0020CB532E|nr:histone deacetylase complex subunit SAP130-like [Astyanax mexicanus]